MIPLRLALPLTLALCCASPAARSQTITLQTALVRVADVRELSVEQSGIVKEVLVVDGDLVESGQLLVQLDDVEAATLLQRAEKELEVARLSAESEVEIQRAEKTAEFAQSERNRAVESARRLKSSFSESELEQRELEYQRALLDLEKARRERAILQATQEIKRTEVEQMRHVLQQRRIEAPMRGMVARITRRPGEWAEPGEKLVRLVSDEQLWAEGFIDVADYHPALKNSRAQLQFTLANKRTLDLAGEVVFINPENDPHNGQIMVRVAFENRERLIRPGMKPQVRIVNSAAPASRSAPGRSTRTASPQAGQGADR